MTTNRMGLEQALSDERLELFIRQPLDNGLTRGEQMELVRELLAYRKASSDPVADVVAWNKPGEERKCDIRWRRFDVAPGPLFTAPPLQAVTVPDEVTFEQAMLMAYGLTPAEAFQKAWNHLRGKILKSVTNEP